MRAVRSGWFRALLTVAATAPFAEGAGVEVAVLSGPAIATYKQTLNVNGGSPAVQLARLNVKDAPSLDAKGGIAFGAGATWFLSKSFGLEARLDTVDVDLQSFGGNYTLELGPAGSPVSSTPVTLGAGETDLRKIKPVSLNLRLQSTGRVGIGLSGGVSYLNSLGFEALPTLSVANLNASIPIALTALPANPDQAHHLGLNGGLTLQVKIAKGFAILAEARGFAFRRAELRWTVRETGALSAIEKALLTSIAAKLELPRFTPGFWTARVGVAYRF